MLGETQDFIKISCVFHLIYTCFACQSVKDKGMTSRNGTFKLNVKEKLPESKTFQTLSRHAREVTCTFKEKLGRALRNRTEVGSQLEVFYYELLGANSQIIPHILVTNFYFPSIFFNTTFRNVMANSFQVRKVLWNPVNSHSSVRHFLLL